MIDLDAMKLARDGQLSYGKPDVFTQRVNACIASGHKGAGAIAYSETTMRCDKCLTFYNVEKAA